MPEFLDPDEPVENIGTVGEFWRWAMSDLLNNRNRGIFAEYIVGKALDAIHEPRLEWDCYDVEYCGVRIEVKSSAYVQSWHQSPEQRSTLSFSVGQHNCWDARTNVLGTEKARHSHLYVFCVFPADPNDPARDVLDLSKWAFYVTTTVNLEKSLKPDARNIGLKKVRRVCGEPVSYGALRTKIDRLLQVGE